MGFLNNFSPETLGIIFVVCLICTVLFIGGLINKASKKSYDNDLSDVLSDCEIFEDETPDSEAEETQCVDYQLKEYNLRFKLIDGMWTPFAVIGVHVSQVLEVRPNKLLRGAMMDTFVALKVKPTNQAV
jgi:hypothetical protein